MEKPHLPGVLQICAALLVVSPPVTAAPDPTYAAEFKARGIVRARAEATIASELVARVDRIPFREGARFSKDDLLVTFDCRRYEAELRAARAEERAAGATLETNLVMKRHNAIGSNELEVSRARLERARADADALNVRTSQCRIVAPFDGRVAALYIHEHEMPQANAPLIRIVDDRSLEIDVIVPSTWLIWLRSDARFLFNVDETGTEHAVRITRLGATIDPISQTLKITGVFAKRPETILPGMSGTARFRKPDG